MPLANRMNGFKGEVRSSFLSCEKDTETIVKKLFVDSNPYSNELKKLLVINKPDCLDNINYLNEVKHLTPKDLKEKGHLRFAPKIEFGEHESVKSYLVFTFDNFVPNANNDYYRDNIIMIDILCHTDYWDLGDYRLRPLKIAGYIDGILNNSKLSGIGELHFIGGNELVLNENLSGYCLMYAATHGVDDLIPNEE